MTNTPLTEPATQIPGVLEVAEAVVFACKAPWLTGEVLDPTSTGT
jgi:3-oxoacyl-[acyl-carrier protein] reductase